MNDKLTLDENAKDEWMKLVKKHKRQQKGLPALSTLNINAGNVEHNVAMFNKMNSPTEGPSNNPISGPFGGDVSSGGDGVAMGEALKLSEELKGETSMIELEYENIPVEVVTRRGNPSGYYDYGFGNWLPDEDETEERLIDWTYKVDKQDVIEFLQDDVDVQLELGIDELTDEEFDKKLLDNFDNLLDKYMGKVLEYFQEDATEDAQENYDNEDYDPYDESVEKKQDEDLDDKFDMSMRTLL